MQVFTFCGENYAKSAGAHTALSETEQHEWAALTTSESFCYATWASSEKHYIYTFTSPKENILLLHKKNLFQFLPGVMLNDLFFCALALPLLPCASISDIMKSIA